MTLILAAPDLHCGSTVGLHDDQETPRDDGGSYAASAAQLWMWTHWLSIAKRVREERRKGEDFFLFLPGDLVDGDHHNTTQIIDRHPGVQMDVLRRCLQPMLDLAPTGILIVRGTEAHVGKSGGVEEAMARQLSGEGYPIIKGKKFSHWKWQGEFDDVVIDVAHHGRMGQRVWTKASVANNLAATIFYEHAALKRRWPDIALRAHFHKYVDTYDNQPVRLIQLPAFQLATAFLHKVAADAIADVGAVLIRTEAGKAQVTPLILHPDPEPVWKPKKRKTP